MGELSPAHWMVVALVVLVLFGSTKLPTFARSIGRSMRIFKSEVKGMNDDADSQDTADRDTAPPKPLDEPPAPRNENDQVSKDKAPTNDTPSQS